MTIPYAEVIGDPIAQSKSPIIHGFWLKQLGIEARYGAHQVTPKTLADYVLNRRDDPAWKGCNVTMPLKQEIMPLLDTIEPDAQKIGAVNTVYRGDYGQLVGANTDAVGFQEPLLPLLEAEHYFRMARIIGTGGAARAIVSALAQHGFAMVIAARNQTKARALLDELASNGEHYTAPLGHFAQTSDFAFDDREGCLDLVVNASPLGMRGHAALEFDWTHAPPGSIAYDIVTDPVRTQFLADAEKAGFKTIDGLAMLVGQAANAFEHFFGRSPPRDADDELRKVLKR